jgi:aspartyl-tRNA(Asn)/glutamyl-tRNA(Gln) amidotransferase subunit A
VLSRILPGADVDAGEIAAMAERRAVFVDAFRAAAAPFAALVWPTVPMVAPLLDALAEDAHYHAANQRALRNPSIVNLADGCAISLPCHGTGAHPVGLTLAAPGGADDRLLAVAAMVEPLLLPHRVQEGTDHDRHQATS